MATNVPVSGGTLSVESRGDGRPVVLVHGFPLDHRMWREQFDVLAATHRVIAPDLRGFGMSLVTPGEVTMAQMADDLAAMLDALDVREPVVLCGLSMGGYVAFQFFLRHRAKLAALILCDTKAAADTPDAAALRHKAAKQILADGPAAIAEAMLHRMFSRTSRESRPEVLKFVEEMILGTSPEGIAAAQIGMAKRTDSTPLLGEIDMPTLLIVGSDDKITPAVEMRQMADSIAESEFVEIPEAGHMAPLESPGPVNVAIGAFLGRVAP